MPCYFPQVARPDGKTAAGKTHYKFVGRYDAEMNSDGRLWESTDKYLRDIVVPCGQCLGCRLERSRQWANRMMMELEYHEVAYFLTLTYNDENVPVHQYYDQSCVDQDTGEVVGDIKFFDSLSLEPKHMTDFIKRLRRSQEYHYGKHDFMYFLCGEYGSQTQRPHYHAIVYDLVIPDLQPFGNSKAGKYPYFRSDYLDKIWKYGFVGVCNVSWETCAYVARYILKKQLGDAAQYYDTFNLVPEFVRMSLKPAIGLRYYEDHKDNIYEYDELQFKTAMRGIACKPPKYFDTKYDLEFPSQMEQIKDQRRKDAHDAIIAQLVNDNRDYIQILADKYENQLKKSKLLKRSVDLYEQKINAKIQRQKGVSEHRGQE